MQEYHKQNKLVIGNIDFTETFHLQFSTIFQSQYEQYYIIII